MRQVSRGRETIELRVTIYEHGGNSLYRLHFVCMKYFSNEGGALDDKTQDTLSNHSPLIMSFVKPCSEFKIIRVRQSVK